MDANTEHLIAATLTAAIVQKLGGGDVNELMRETVRVYRLLSRRLHKFHEDDERLQLVGEDTTLE